MSVYIEKTHRVSQLRPRSIDPTHLQLRPRVVQILQAHLPCGCRCRGAGRAVVGKGRGGAGRHARQNLTEAVGEGLRCVQVGSVCVCARVCVRVCVSRVSPISQAQSVQPKYKKK